MHWAVATVALTLLAFAAISGRIAGTPITGAMIFTAVGLPRVYTNPAYCRKCGIMD